MLEQKLQKKIIDELEAKGFYVVNVIVSSKVGTPDILACSPSGSFWAIEVKRPNSNEVPSKLQEYNLAKIAKTGGVSFWCRSLDEFRRKYKELALLIRDSSKAVSD